jgi:hypothetical protein
VKVVFHHCAFATNEPIQTEGQFVFAKSANRARDQGEESMTSSADNENAEIQGVEEPSLHGKDDDPGMLHYGLQ